MQRMKIDFPRRLKRMSISKRITIIYAIFFLLLLVIISAFVIVNTWMYYGKISRSELEETADSIVKYIEEGGEISSDALEQLNPNKYVEVIVSEEGRGPIGHDPFMINPENKQDFSVFPPPDFDNTDKSDMHFRTGRFNNEQYLYTIRFAHYNGTDYSVQVFRPQSKELAVMRIFIFAFLVFNAAAVFISAKIGKTISRIMLKPIREMTSTADKISIEDLSRRITVPEADDEFRTLALTFNAMIDRLETSFEKQKQFVSDASHELRTPISVIQGYASLIDRWGKSDAEVLQESINSIRSETEHMNVLINQLLFLAREDKGTNEINMERLNLWEVADEVARESEMTDENICCTITGDKEACVMADSHMIKQTLRIIIENDLKYTKEIPCQVKINISTQGDKVLMGISDKGIGISQEDLGRIFDRFFRSDKSRNKEIPGNGLGLSIAQTIIKRHNGRIWAESELGKGTTFYIELDKA